MSPLSKENHVTKRISLSISDSTRKELEKGGREEAPYQEAFRFISNFHLMLAGIPIPTTTDSKLNKFFSPEAQEAQWVQQFTRESKRISMFVRDDLIRCARVEVKWYKKNQERESALLIAIFAEYGCYRTDFHWEGIASATVSE